MWKEVKVVAIIEGKWGNSVVENLFEKFGSML